MTVPVDTMAARALAMASSRASWVIMTTGTASPGDLLRCSMDSMEIAWSARHRDRTAMTPGRSITVNRR